MMSTTSSFMSLDYSLSPLVCATVAFESIRSRGILSECAVVRTVPLIAESLDAIPCDEDKDDDSLSSLFDSMLSLRGGGGDGSSYSHHFHSSKHQLAFAVNLPTHHVHLHTTLHDSMAVVELPSDDAEKLRQAATHVDEVPSLANNMTATDTLQRPHKKHRFRRLFHLRRKSSRDDTSVLVETSHEIPLRFTRAAKGNPVIARQRYRNTLTWRKQYHMDTILKEPHFQFEFIKQQYPHYFHLRGRNNEPVYYEMPPKTNLAALREGGVDIDILLRHYAMVTEFTWQYVERDDLQQSIYVIDLEGIKITDFVGESVDFVRRACAFCNQHYPERSGCILVVNVPSYFKTIWRVIKRFADKKTLGKVKILRGKEEILETLLEFIPMEHIPPEYGGTSMPLGEAPEEELLWNVMRHNNHVAVNGTESCGGKEGNCPFCTFEPARTY